VVASAVGAGQDGSPLAGAPSSEDPDNTPAVTVVIPTRDRRQLLLRTLDSVLRQDGVRFDVVVVDDGGTDGTAEAVEKLRLPNVRVLRHECSRGVSAARNAGLRTVTAPWVAFVDDDDLWAPDKLRAQLESLEQCPEARWSCVDAIHVDDCLRALWRAPAPPSGDISDVMLHSAAVPGGGSGVLADTDLVREIGGFDEKLSITADWDLYIRLSLRSPMAAVARPCMAYYMHTDSMFHDPAGVVRELFLMEDKYATLSDGRRFHFDRVLWYVMLARMAQRLGDRRTAVRLWLEGLAQAGVTPITRDVVRRARLRLRGGVHPYTFEEQSIRWLARYAGQSPS